MESQLSSPHVHHDSDQKIKASEHDHGSNHDMSIFKKVKERARMVKDKIKKHYGDDHHISDDQDSDEKEGNEEMTEDADVHGEQIYESEKIRDEPRQMETTGHVAHHRFDRQDKNDNAGMHSGGLSASMQGKTAIDQGTGINQQMDFGSDLQRSPGERKLNFEKPLDLGVDSVALKNQTTDSTASNDQSKATDPTAKGVEEIRTSPIDQDMGKITLNDTEPSQKPNIANGEAVSTVAPTGSHNQFFEELVPPGPQSFESVPETFIATKFKDQPQDSNTDGRPLNLSSYTSSPNNPKQDPETYSERTPTDQENQSSYTPSLENPQHDPEDYDGSKTRVQEKQSGHTDQISSVTSAIAHKAAAAKDVASKLGYAGDKEDAGTHGQRADESESYDDTEHSQCDQGREMQTNQRDSYTRKISSAAAAVTSTAISAKNVVASKLGYGEKCDNKHPIQEEESGKQQDSASKHEIGETAKGQGKGVSMDYFSEKLKPRDEDKALSELISEALQRQKIYPQKGEHEEKPMGKLTESEEVPKRLGSDDDKSSEKEQSNFVNVPRDNMVDKLKGAVSSWFGGAESQTPERSGSSTSGQDSGHDSNIIG